MLEMCWTASQICKKSDDIIRGLLRVVQFLTNVK